ncbi:MAG TPA: hypothetical protein VFU38_10305, partial [Candidatus Krumholzibacteria bacterium]|nr:hypothetical protein [Candidatus Krumholzibacteria bacterium]
QNAISPDNNNTQDESRIRYRLSAVAQASLIVYLADSITPVRTLKPLGPEGTTEREYFWNGRRDDDSPVPEGKYIVTLYASTGSNPDSVLSLPIFVDVTPPSVQIVSVLPNPYAPGAPGSTASVNISFTVSNASPTLPGRVPDELRSAFTTPSGATLTPVSLTTTPPFAGQNGNYVLTWNATAEANVPPDGEFTVTVTLADVAGYTATSTYHFDVDTRAPDVKATSLPENISVAVVPDSLHGFAFDLHGIDSLAVRYATDRPYRLVTGAVVIDDTLRFAVPLADSFTTQGAHLVEFRATDVFGRPTTYPFNFSLDTSAPPAPTLDPAPSTWNATRYPLTGHANDGGDAAAFVRVYRNGVAVDSVSTLISDDFEIDLELVPGRNDIYAVLRDGAMNASPPSNTLTITFDTGAGLFVRAPFRPGDTFDVNGSRTAGRCTVRVFDLTGQIVRVLEEVAQQQYYTLPWNGVNGSGVDVKKGPLIAVASIEYRDGTRDVFREVFLYDPNAP